MTNDSETVRELFTEAKGRSWVCYWNESGKPMEDFIARMEVAYEREMVAKDAERFRYECECIELRDRIALLERALKPVMECDEDEYPKLLNALRAVREAQRIILEAWDDNNYFWKDNKKGE